MTLPRSDREKFAYWTLVLAAFTAAWSGVSLGPGKLVDILLAAAFLFGGSVLLHRPWGVPVWVKLGAVGIVLVLIVHGLAPTSQGYLLSRINYAGMWSMTQANPESPYFTAGKWLFALLFVPWLVLNTTVRTGRSIERVIWAWALGAAASAAVALSDYLGVTHISLSLLGFVDISHRQAGLASHPNNLGFSCAMSMPVAIHFARTHRKAGTITMALLLAGVILSGSRGSQVCTLVALILTVLLPSSRARLVPVAVYIAGWCALVVLWRWSDVQDLTGSLLRFTDNGAAATSTAIRDGLAQQAISDFHHRPVFGVGYGVLFDAHSIYLQLFAAGGILLALCIGLFWIGAVRTGWKLRKRQPFAVFLVCSILTWLIDGLIENQLTDRYLYFPVAGICALLLATQRKSTEDMTGLLTRDLVESEGARSRKIAIEAS